ncbi:MAG TPA: NADH-quinone oxidoreductase subunit A [Candidatus Kapabacteria bacterium]|nr:NADH-quinone oxidoreductase subunit A [Candidatus Kapabacteria bacterium]
MFATYLSITIMIIAGFAVAAIFLALSAWFGAKRTTPEKQTTYESGVEPVGTARKRFNVRFYMVAVSFIIFDIYVVFLYPWAVQAANLGVIPFIGVLIFIAILLLAYLFELKKGGFEWD